MDEESTILNKILSAVSPLLDWNVRVHCGIGAGYRTAFVVDDASDEGKYICAVLNSTLAPSLACAPCRRSNQRAETTTASG